MNKRYSDFLLNYLNNKFENIKLTRRYLDGWISVWGGSSYCLQG
jgi:hypothetical protein